LALFAAADPGRDRLRGLHRRGERRWDLVLDREQVIQLPENNPVPVLESLMALDKAQDLMSRHVTHIDLRNGRRPTVRLAPEAVEELRHIKSLEAGDASR
jgi:cell division protein FtsQ